MWLCTAPDFGVTWVSEVDASTPLGVECHQVEVTAGAPSTTQWNAGVRWLRWLLRA
jgi:hypothetical protein